MARGINVIAALLACATLTSAVLLAPFPHGKTTVYRYKSLVKATATEDALYASLFAIHGTLDIEHDTRDPELVNAYNVVLSDVAFEMFNGYTGNRNETLAAMSDDSAVRVIQEPFLIVYNRNGTFQGVKIPENEAEWSRNMKMAMASTLQLDVATVNAGKTTLKPYNFVSREKTIYGECSVSYEVNHDKRLVSKSPKVFQVKKTFTPMECDGFPLHEFNNVDNGQEKERNDDVMYTESSRLFEVEKQGHGLLIRKLDAYGMVSVLSDKSASYPHFVITNTSFELLKVKDKTAAHTPLGVFVDVPMTRDVTYRSPEKSNAPGAGIDVTQGRRVVNQTDLIDEVSVMLLQAVHYLEENHVSPDGIDLDRARVLNKMLRAMSLMTQGSFDRVSYPVEMGEARAHKIGSIFIGLAAQVGTPVSCRYTLELIASNLVPAWLALDVLPNLALSVRQPTLELLEEMKDLARLSAPVPVEVRKAGILSFATLIYRTFKNAASPEANAVLNGYLDEFADRLMSEPSIETKVVYLMALRNVEIGKVADLLEPIVTGRVRISEDPERIRLLAIWAIDKPLEKNYTTAVRVLWPVMENAALPTKLRLAAYEILMKHAPSREDALRVHRYMSTQENRHFYQYHYTNLDSIAKSVDKKREKLREVIYTIFEGAEYPPEGHEDIRYTLSTVESFRYVDDNFWHSEKLDLATIVNELTGLPEVVRFEHTTTDRNGAISDLAVQVHVEGDMHVFEALLSPFREGGLTRTAVRDLLDRIARSLPSLKNLQADVVVSRSGRVVAADHYDYARLVDVSRSLMSDSLNRSSISHQLVDFDRLYEKHVTSELGVPVVIENRVPIVRSVSIGQSGFQMFPINWDFTMELKSWKHADDSMSVYNPIADAWHSIRSAAGAEFSLPFSLRFEALPKPDDDLPRDEDLRLSFPELPATISPIAGFVYSADHLVTVDEVGAEALTLTCPSCARTVTVLSGSEPIEYPYRENSVDSADLGLKFTAGTQLGEMGDMSEAYQGYLPQWNVTFDPHIPHTWLDSVLQVVWSIRGKFYTEYLDTQVRSSVVFLKIEPSVNHSISHISHAGHGMFADLDVNETTVECLHADRWIFDDRFTVISAVTNSTVRSWKFDLDTDKNRGHLVQKFSLRVTRETPGEKNYKFCVDGKKNYPVPPEDDLRLGATNEEIDSKLTFAYGVADDDDDDDCIRNGSVLAVTLKAQLSDEQKSRLKHDLENSECSKDKKNPWFSGLNGTVPRTYNCMNEAIRYTTPRKYTLAVTHTELTPGFAGFVYRRLTEKMEPRKTGEIEYSVEFPMDSNRIDFVKMTDIGRSVSSSDSLRSALFDFYGPTLNPLWDFPLDNSRFPKYQLFQYTMNNMKMCSIYPKVVMTGDGEYVPYAVPSDQWVLITGDHWDKNFAVFVKQSRPNQFSSLILYRDEAIQFYTRESDNVLVVKEEETGCRSPGNPHQYCFISIRKKNDHFVVRLRPVDLTILVGPNDMSITFNSDLQGRVSGLCGHLNGTHPGGAPEFYSLREIDGYQRR